MSNLLYKRLWVSSSWWRGLFVLSLSFVALISSAPSAHGQSAHSEAVDSSSAQGPAQRPVESKSEASVWERGLGATLAIFPGLLISGGGHLMVGQSAEARRLFWMKLSSLGGLIASGALVARSGASEYVTPWGVPLMLGSGLTFAGVTLLDLIGTLSEPQPPIAALSGAFAPAVRAGERRSLSLIGGLRESASRAQHAHWGARWAQQLGSWAYMAQLSGADEQLRLGVSLERALYAQPVWGSWVRLGYAHHMIPRASATLRQLELTSRWVAALGPLIARSLSALRAELWVGWAGGVIQYPQEALDGSAAILGGLNLSHSSLQDRLRVTIGYDHRHDGWEGGAVLQGVGSGVFGSTSAELMARLSRSLWLGARGAWGASHIYTLNIAWGAR